MKILEVIPDLMDGGAQRFVIDLSNRFIKHPNVEVIILSYYKQEDSWFFLKEIDKNIRLIFLNKKTGFDYKIIINIYNIIRKEKPDIIHTHLNTLNYVLPVLTILKTPCFHTIHNDAMKECPNKFLRIFRHVFYKSKKCIPITISKESSSSYVKVYNNDNNIEIFNGRPVITPSIKYKQVKSEIDSYKVSDSTKVFVNIARIAPQKNQKLLVHIFNKLIEEGNDVVLLIIGAPTDITIEKILKNIIKKNIYILGSKENPFDYLLNSDGFCLTSVFEGMPITLIEAFQAGCIPICTPVGGVKEMINTRENGFLSSDLSEKAYYNAMMEFLTLTESEIKLMKKNCKESYKKQYSIIKTADSYYNLFIKYS